MSDDSLSKITQTHKSRMTPVCFEVHDFCSVLQFMTSLSVREGYELWLSLKGSGIISEYGKKYMFRFTQHMHRPVISIKVGSCTFSSHLTWTNPPAARGKGVWRRSFQRLAILGDLLPNNPFLGMFQLKFCLKTFKTCSLFYISVLNVAF